jgi:hypothetical protein
VSSENALTGNRDQGVGNPEERRLVLLARNLKKIFKKVWFEK